MLQSSAFPHLADQAELTQAERDRESVKAHLMRLGLDCHTAEAEARTIVGSMPQSMRRLPDAERLGIAFIRAGHALKSIIMLEGRTAC